MSDVISQLFSAGEKDVASLRIDRLAPEQAGEIRIGNGMAKVLQCSGCPVWFDARMFEGLLKRMQAIALSISRKHGFPKLLIDERSTQFQAGSRLCMFF
nr:hypothetical protein [Pseudomonas parafulva]